MMMRKLFKLARDQRGASIIELALVTPFFATLIIGVVDISSGYGKKLQLEQAAQRAIEKAMQGKKELSLYKTLKAEGAAAAGVTEDKVTVKYWLECNGVSQYTSDATMDADFEKNCPSDKPVYARYVNISIEQTYTPMFKSKLLGTDSAGNYLLVGEAGMRVQ